MHSLVAGQWPDRVADEMAFAVQDFMADKDDGPPPTPDWIVTFIDLMSLLFTFFILLLTFSTPRVEKLFELRGSLRGSFGVFGPERDDRDTDL